MTEEEKQRVKFDGDLPKLHHHHPHHHHHHHRHRHHPIYLTSTPDGGWGWVVIFCTFLVFFFTLGFKTSLGVFYVEWERYFDNSKFKVSWVTSISPFMIGLVSPFAASVSHAIGPRPPVMFGGIIASAGLLGSSYSQDVYHLLLTIGVVSAIGMGFAFAPSIVVLHHYFEKRFVIANGVAFAGISCGELVFPVILQPMIKSYGWSGALFIMAAVELNLVVCGFVMIRPKPRPIKHVHPSLSSNIKKSPSGNKLLTVGFLDSYAFTNKSYEKSSMTNSNSELSLVDSGFKENRRMDKSIDMTEIIDETRRGRSYSSVSCTSSAISICSSWSSTEEPRPRFLSDPSKSIALFMFGPSDDYTQQQDDWNTDWDLEIPGIRFDQRDHGDFQKRQRGNSIRSHHSFIEASYNVILEIKHERFLIRRPLKNRFFLVMIFVMLLHGIGWYAVIAHIIPSAIYYGIPDNWAYDLIPFIGIGSLFGCLTHGWFIDKNMVSSEYAKIISLGTLTIITLVYPAAHYSYLAMLTLSIIYGIAAGISLPLFFALVRQLLPPEDVNAGVSLLIIAEMLGDTIGGVSAGLLYDLTNDYKISFFFAAASIGAAMLLQMILSILKRRSKIREKHSYECRELSEACGGFKERLSVGNPVPNQFVLSKEGPNHDVIKRKENWGII